VYDTCFAVSKNVNSQNNMIWQKSPCSLWSFLDAILKCSEWAQNHKAQGF
jgi:hypothetical protein